MTYTYSHWRSLLFYTLGLCLTILLTDCKNTDKTTVGTDSTQTARNSINVKFAPNGVLSPAEIKNAFLISFPKLDSALVNVRSCPCDSALQNITLPPDWIIQGQSGVLKVQPPGGATEGDIALPGMLLTGINYTISTFDDSQIGQDKGNGELANYFGVDNKDTTRTIKIAVFDSGLVDGFIPSMLLKPTYQCTEGRQDKGVASSNGWNFTNENITNLEDIIHHGSRVAYLVAKQFNQTTYVPHIIPMRVLNSKNEGDLFGLLCAMETARLNNVNVFNMSLGYYGDEDTLLRQYTEASLRQGIWIVTAAGNRRENLSTEDRDFATMQPKFYPANFSQNKTPLFDKFLATTSILVNSGNIIGSLRQNYGKESVVGVQADTDNSSTSQEGRFSLIDGRGQSWDVFGTSYAAPVLSGRLAIHLIENRRLSRADLLNTMSTGTGGNQVIENRYIPRLPSQ